MTPSEQMRGVVARVGRAGFNAEHIRILRAAARGTLTENEHGRWIITDEDRRPARREREQLLHRRKLIVRPGGYGSGNVPNHPAKLSSGGEDALELIEKQCATAAPSDPKEGAGA